MEKRVKSFNLSLLFVVFLLCGNAGAKKDGMSGNPADELKFRHFPYIDQQGTGLQVFSFLMPVDWQFEGGINWILDNPAMPATIPFRVYNTKGKEEFEAFANHCYGRGNLCRCRKYDISGTIDERNLFQHDLVC